MLTHVARVTENFIGTHRQFLIVPISVMVGFYGTMRMVREQDIIICEDEKNSVNLHSTLIVKKYSGLWKDRHEITLRTFHDEVIEVIDVKLSNIEVNCCEIQRVHQFAEGKACLSYTLDIFYCQDGIYKVHHTPNLSTCCRHTFNIPPVSGCRLIFTNEYKIMDLIINRPDAWCHINNQII